MTHIRYEKGFAVAVTLFSLLLVLCNLIGTKFFKLPFFEYAVPCSLLVYPFTFLISDAVAEIWGKERANFMVYLGFGASLISLVAIEGAMRLSPHPYWFMEGNSFGYQSAEDYQKAFESVFSVSYKVVFGSLLAYLSAQLVDIRLYLFFKKLTHDKHLWLRNNLSTWASQFLDTLIVNSIVLIWGFHMPLNVAAEIVLATYSVKVLISICNTPLFYFCISSIKGYIGHEKQTA